MRGWKAILFTVGKALLRFPAWLGIQAILFYQRGVSPLIGARCKFHPTCSQYSLEAIKKYGLVVGSMRGVYRILRCHPWSQGGYDPP
jgi:putative membrane protein insertion efficiency factor